MQIFVLRKEYKKELKYYENTKQFFFWEGDIGRRTIVKDIPEKEVLKSIEEGKIAIFPIYEKQKMDVVDGHAKLGFNIYFMRYKAFEEFREKYIESCVNVHSNTEELKQEELF